MTSVLTSARKAYAQARPFALTMLVGAAALTIALAGGRGPFDSLPPRPQSVTTSLEESLTVVLQAGQHRLPLA